MNGIMKTKRVIASIFPLIITLQTVVHAIYYPVGPLTLQDALFKAVCDSDPAGVAMLLDAQGDTGMGNMGRDFGYIDCKTGERFSVHLSILEIACWLANGDYGSEDKEAKRVAVASLLLRACAWAHGGTTRVPPPWSSWMPLVSAVRAQSSKLVRLLLSHGARVEDLSGLLLQVIGDGTREHGRLSIFLDLIGFYRSRLTKSVAEEALDGALNRHVRAALRAVGRCRLTRQTRRIRSLLIGLGNELADHVRESRLFIGDYADDWEDDLTDLWETLGLLISKDEELLAQLSTMTVSSSAVFRNIAVFLDDNWDQASLCMPAGLRNDQEKSLNLFYLCERYCPSLSVRLGFLCEIPAFLARQLAPPHVRIAPGS